MTLTHKTSFLTPTAKLKQLSLLQHIEENPDTTQKEIGKAISAAPSMVNQYLNEYEDKDYIQRIYISAKVVKYKITAGGIKRKNYLLITYLHELLKLYKLAEDNVDLFLDYLEGRGYREILLYGAGEVAETILGIIKAREAGGLKVVGLIDDDASRAKDRLLGYEIIAREDIAGYDHDAVVITSYTYEEEITGKLEEIDYPGDKVIRFFGA